MKHNLLDFELTDVRVENVRFFQEFANECDLYIKIENGGTERIYKKEETRLDLAKKVKKYESADIDIRTDTEQGIDVAYITQRFNTDIKLTETTAESFPEQSTLCDALLIDDSVVSTITDFEEVDNGEFCIETRPNDDPTEVHSFTLTPSTSDELREALGVSALVGEQVELTLDNRAHIISSFSSENEDGVILTDEFTVPLLYPLDTPLQYVPLVVAAVLVAGGFFTGYHGVAITIGFLWMVYFGSVNAFRGTTADGARRKLTSEDS